METQPKDTVCTANYGGRSSYPSSSTSAVEHPAHYNKHPSGIECIDIAEAFSFNLGNVIKYVFRAGFKDNEVQDLEKAAWYLRREISRRATTTK
jgi:hypothetical protein